MLQSVFHALARPLLEVGHIINEVLDDFALFELWNWIC